MNVFIMNMNKRNFFFILFLVMLMIGITSSKAVYSAAVTANMSGSSVQVPPPPYGVIAYWVKKNAISWSWAPSAGATYYELYLNDILKGLPTASQFTTEGLSINTQYTAKVRACNSGGCSAFAAPKSSYTHIQNAFYFPKNLIPVSTNSVTLQFDGTFSNLTSGLSGIDHAVFPDDSNGYGNCAAELQNRSDAQQNNNPVVFSGLSPSTCYLGCGYPTNGDGVMPQNPFPCTTFVTLAKQPSGSKQPFVNVMSNQVTVQWGSNGNPSRSGSGGNFCSKATEYRLHNITRNTFSSWITGISYQDIKLTSGKQYCYEVKARNADTIETAWTSLGCVRTSGAMADIK